MIKNIVFDIGGVLADFRIKEFLMEKGMDGPTIIVFYACKDKSRFWLYPLAILLHTAMDFVAGLTSVGVWNPSVWALEGINVIFGVLTFCGAFFLLYKRT